MRKHIIFQNEYVPYTIKKSTRAQRVRLAVHRDGSVVATIPLSAHESVAEKFAQEKAGWVMKKITYFRQHRNDGAGSFGRQEYMKHKHAALAVIRDRVEHFNNIYGFSYNTISVKDQRSRWGSCSQKGNLNFSYRLLFLSTEVRDFIIVHELCHLKEFNHSYKFWELVARAVPDHKIVREKLKKEGLRLV